MGNIDTIGLAKRQTSMLAENTRKQAAAQCDSLIRYLSEIRRDIDTMPDVVPNFNTSGVLDLARLLGKLDAQIYALGTIEQIEENQ